MGIPSYFRKIIQRYPGILCQRVSDCSLLCFDFNCLVYRCIRAPSMLALEVPEVGHGEAMDAWEAELLHEVCRTVKEVWAEAGRPRQVYIAVDGVVPMAKIRQQRVRRFKSAYLRRMGTNSESSHRSWDTNSITPGTAFMDKLGRELHRLAKEQGRGWIVSTSDEPGEGEHKIMSRLRENRNPGTICIYGLDADLILLSMLTGEMISNENLWLMREKQEFGAPVAHRPDEKQEYTFMNLEEFKVRVGVKGVNEVLNYVGLMSLMGNDFLPHSMTHKLNDDGHECVLSELRAMKGSGRWLVDAGGQLQTNVLLTICASWAREEEGRMMHMIRKKREQAGRGVGKGMDPSEGLPLQWNVEKVMVEVGTGNSENFIQLKEGWRTEYWNWIHPFADRVHLCSEYVYGLQWILDYYTGQAPINTSWMFPSWIPPLWSDLALFLKKAEGGNSGKEGVRGVGAVIQPAEQLAMVLPLESWGLIRDKNLRRLPALAPQMWPLNYSFFSAGRKWLWECEARIPVLTAERAREILKGAE